ncbi:energy transducer TonB [Dyadobacter sp. LJ53]|uniref:energy transducer TonB n=1 Tax=Dyadobacter chenwenxiniae TaxID=2906456 RepID=UPI001F2802E3|nr:energy transducer TonB [Dyadobacter chenwenxiniae]MCF0048686.1 energy transducer TonB [Dyadobacter chenwenxiniae]
MAENRSDMAGFEEFRRYQNGEMSTREQHLLEKQMLEDPMLAEAYEGFLAMHRNTADLAGLQKELKQNLERRTTNHRKWIIPLWTYGAAASLVLTLGTLWLMFVSNPQKGDNKETGQNLVEIPVPEAETPLQSEPQTAPPSAPETKHEIASQTEKPTLRTTTPASRAQEPEPATVVSPRKFETDLAAADHDDQVSVPAAVPAEKQAFANTARGPVPAPASRVREQPKYKKSQTVVPEATSVRSLTALPVPADSVMELTASPLMGWDAYRSYLEKRTAAARRKGEVTVSFYVNTDGTLADLTAEGKRQLQPEAIRIVKEGPQWVPGRQNGSAVRTPVKVILNFKK